MEAIKVNLIPNGIPEACHASQYDEGRQIRLDLFDELTPYTIQAGDTFTLNVRKPDNHVITETVTGTEGNTYLIIDTTEQMTAVTGENLCEIRLENGGDNIGSLNFIMQVERDVIANGIPSESVIEDLEALVIEAVGDNYYTKTETDELLAQKADVTDLLDLLPTDSASGAVANFTDGADNVPVKALSVEFAASQDLHGQSAPYPAGGGVNKWDEETELGIYNSTTGEKEPSTTQLRSKNFIPVTPNTTYFFQTATANDRVLFYDASKNYLNDSVLVTVNTFTTPANCYYVAFHMGSSYGTTYRDNVSINYPATDTAYHPYSNICPIIPVNSIAVTRTGKNLFDKSNTSQILNAYLNQNNIVSGANMRTVFSRCKPNTTYTVSKNAGQRFSIGYTDKMPVIGGTLTANIVNNTASYISITTDANAKYIVAFVYNQNADTGTAEQMLASVQIEQGSTATAYEAYNGVTKTLALGGDYYGGEVDKDGNITSNVRKIVFDGSQTVTVATSNYIKSDACDGFINVDDVYPNVSYVYQEFDFRSNKLAYADKKNIWQITGYPNCFVVNNKQFHLNIANDLLGVTDYTQETTASVKQKITDFLTNNPIEVIYCVAPATAQASNAIDFNTLLGDNNFFSDAGDVDVTIRADIALYIQKMLGGNANRSLGANPSILRTGAISTDIEVREPVEPDSEPVELEREVTEQPENEGNDNEER